MSPQWRGTERWSVCQWLGLPDPGLPHLGKGIPRAHLQDAEGSKDSACQMRPTVQNKEGRAHTLLLPRPFRSPGCPVILVDLGVL